MSENTRAGARGAARKGWTRFWRPVRNGTLTAVAFVAAVAWTATLDLPWRGASGEQLTLAPLVVRALTPAEETERVASVLEQHTKNPAMAQRIAAALVSEGRKQQIDPALLVGVLLVENTTLNPRARSKVGARGLMQVMPLHSGRWGCGTRDLYNVETNICYGTKIFGDLLRRTQSVETALLRYNGCVRGTNTPNCHSYPRHVLKRARLADAALLAVNTSE